MIDPRNNERAGVSPRDEGVSAGPTSTDTDSLSESSALDREVQQAMEGMDPQDLADLSGDVQMPSQAGVTPSSSLNRGLEMTARVVAIDGDDVFLDYGGKSQAVLPRTQLEDPENVKPGQILDVTVDRFEGDSGLLLVNRKGAIRKAEWDSLEVGMVVQGRVTGMIKGGLELSVNNLRAFMPASHASLVPLKDVSVLLNENLQAIVIEVDAKAKNFVVSHRKYLQKEQKENRKKLMTELDVGQTRDGTVNNITEFGAFVDLGGVDGLIHISDLSWTNVDKVTDVVNIGDKVQVQVQKIENNGKRISLSLKHTQPDPWMGAANRFPEGASVKARVVRLTNFGAFAELEPGVEALIPVSEMGWSRVQKPSDAVKKDETVDAVVIRVEPERRRIALSMKQAQKDPWEGVLESFEPNSLVTGKVTRIADFGAFVEVTTGVEGLIHISELSDQRVRTVSDVVKVGQEVETRVLGVDADSRRISLSIKAVKNPPSEEIALEAAEPAKPRKRKKALRGGLSSHFEW